jgi:shikimate kinase
LLGPELTSSDLPCSLIGLPGCGKSAIGKALAQRLSWPFIDSDKVIEGRAGCTIAALFAREGEAEFRRREAEVLASLVGAGRAVIATGGGAVLRGDNRNLLRTHTVSVYLRAPHDLLWKRLRRDRRRPLLQVADPEARLRELSAVREPLYRETAQIVVEVDGRTLEAVIEDIVHHITRPEHRS